MFEHFIDSLRRASESSLDAQRDLFRSWSQQWFTGAGSGGSGSERWRSFQKRSLELVTDSLDRHREIVDATYKSAIQAFEEAFRVSETRAPDDYRRTAEELWMKLFQTFRAQYETQLQEFQKLHTSAFEMSQQPTS